MIDAVDTEFEDVDFGPDPSEDEINANLALYCRESPYSKFFEFTSINPRVCMQYALNRIDDFLLWCLAVKDPYSALEFAQSRFNAEQIAILCDRSPFGKRRFVDNR